MNSLHILGISNPSAQYLLIKLNKQFNFYCYSSTNKKKLATKVFNYSDLKNNFKNDDSIISFIPIEYLTLYLNKLNFKLSTPKSIIVCSSTSIDSKILNNSPDSNDYQKFLLGEHSLMELCLKSKKEINLVILRLSLLWGGRNDKNINLIYQLLKKYRIFPLSNQANGIRFPMHHSYLAATILNIIKKPINSGIYSLQGPEPIPYKKMVKLIQDRVPNKSFLILFPKNFLVILIKFFILIRIKKCISVLMMIYRQNYDLDFSKKNHVPFENLPNKDQEYNFEDLIKIIY